MLSGRCRKPPADVRQLFNAGGNPKDGSPPDPAIQAASIVADEEAIALPRFHEVEVFVPATSDQYNISNPRIALAKRGDRHPITVVDPTCDGVGDPLALAVPRSRWRQRDHRAGSSALRSPSP